MNTASLELCKELYELSGWDKTDKSWWIEQWGDYDREVARYAHKQDEDDNNSIHYPAYDLGYLLRKLPSSAAEYLVLSKVEGKYACYMERQVIGDWSDSPENAAAKLAIELFKKGILTK